MQSRDGTLQVAKPLRSLWSLSAQCLINKYEPKREQHTWLVRDHRSQAKCRQKNLNWPGTSGNPAPCLLVLHIDIATYLDASRRLACLALCLNASTLDRNFAVCVEESQMPWMITTATEHVSKDQSVQKEHALAAPRLRGQCGGPFRTEQPWLCKRPASWAMSLVTADGPRSAPAWGR